MLLAYFPFSKLMHMAGVFLSPTRNLANNNRMVRHVNPWDYPVKVHPYEEYEDELQGQDEGGRSSGREGIAMAKPDEVGYYKQEDLLKVDYSPPKTAWMDTPVDFRPGSFIYPGKAKNLKILDLPNPRDWAVTDDDWKLQDDWKKIVLEGMAERLKKYRSFKLFMDICVRCGACADKCHFFIGGGDPKNMPVLRAELLRSDLPQGLHRPGQGPRQAGRRPRADRRRDQGVVLLLLPVHRVPALLGLLPLRHRHGRDHHDRPGAAGPARALHQLGRSSRWPTASGSATTWRSRPTAWSTRWSSWSTTSRKPPASRSTCPINKKGAEILFVTPSGDFVAAPGIYTCMAYMLLFHELGLDYTFSTYASEGGNFGLFTSHEMIKRLNAKIYAEAKRLGVKWILGGECGHMWRVMHQYMDTMNGPADFLEVPKSPITGTVFENAKSTKMSTSWSSWPT